MRGFGDAFVSPVDFGAGQAAAERQSQQLPMTLLRCRQLRSALALAESRGGERMQDFANDAEAASRGVLGAAVRVLGRGAAQDRQRLCGRLPQYRLLAGSGNFGRKARGFAIVGRRRRPDQLNTVFPFREVSIHGATPDRMTTTQG